MTSAAAIQNKKYAALLGWTPADLGIVEAVPNEEALVTEIRTRQMMLGVMPVDGVCGPRTFSASLAARQAQLVTTMTADPEARIRAAGMIAVCEAKRTWLRNIVDLPPRSSSLFEASRSTIDHMIRSASGIDWDWLEPYLGNFEWCGAFAAHAWRAAGLRLASRRNFWSSNIRLDRWARYQPFEAHQNPRPASGPYRMLVELDEDSSPANAVFPDGSLPRAGDILTIGGVNTAYGKHITLVESFDPKTGLFQTIEGNGTGLSPAGNKQHGVIRATRRIGLLPGTSPATYFARRLIRPAASDLV